jgi:hypothetical protein
MAAFVRGEETSCEMVADGADIWTLDAIGYMTSRSRAESQLSSSSFAQRGKQQNRQLTKRRRVTSTVTAQWGGGNLNLKGQHRPVVLSVLDSPTCWEVAPPWSHTLETLRKACSPQRRMVDKPEVIQIGTCA